MGCSPIGLQRQNAQYFGAAAKTRPATAEQCAQLAKVGAVAGSIEAKDLKLDQAFCLITDEELPSLVFEVAIWKRG